MLCRFGEGSAAQGFRCAVQLPTCWTAACTDTANMRDVAGRLFVRAVQAGASRARTQSSPIAVQGSTCGRVKLGRHVQKTQVHSRSSARGQSAKVLDHGLDKIVYTTLSSLKRIFGAMILQKSALARFLLESGEGGVLQDPQFQASVAAARGSRALLGRPQWAAHARRMQAAVRQSAGPQTRT